MSGTALALPGRFIPPSPGDLPRLRRTLQPCRVGMHEDKRVILIAEDHLDSREALRVLLEASGYEVVLAEDGQEAVRQAVEVRPDLIIMDIMMPNVDGFEATRRIRAEEELKDTPILALTAMEGAQNRVIEAGCNACVTKPIDVRGFLAMVNRWLERRGVNGASCA